MQSQIFTLLNDPNEPNLNQSQKNTLKHINSNLTKIISALNAKSVSVGFSLKGGGGWIHT
ncbi:hypothetical protein [Campylobacter curvus]|uniref:hypothetical protein n=1 Tax=Campylobacter curvus TaxID=200 RepID=UPI00147078E3|nr:hypothetical protein [Campylobacter curvus]